MKKNPEKSLPNGIICDLDGTLALLGDRNPYNHMGAAEDFLNVPVAKVVRAFYDLGYKILFVSGRKIESEKITRKWLRENLGKDIEKDCFLLMRANQDDRKDVIVKRELYQHFIKDKYHVEFVLDDRDQVVEFWRKEGLPCLQVAYGDF